MKRLLLSLALALTTVLACAATATSTITTTAPTIYTDGTALNPADLAGYELVCSFTPTGATSGACTASTPSSTSSGAVLNQTVTLTYPAAGGQVCYQTRARSTNGNIGAPSPITAASCKTLPDSRIPGTPSNTTITITLALTISSATPISVAMAAPVIASK